MVKPILTSLSQILPLSIQEYERYLPTAFDESMTLLQKMNKVIKQLNSIGELTNEIVEKWNEVMDWVMNEGLETAVNAKLDEMSLDGTLADLINVVLFGEFNEKFYWMNNNSVIRLGVDAAKNAPHDPVYTGDKFYKNLAIGGNALENAIAVYNNIAIGWNALNAAEKGEYYNIAIGNESLYNSKKPDGDVGAFTASRNIAIGMNAQRFGQKAYQNLSLGRNSLQCNENGNWNTALGVNAMSGVAPIDLDGNIINNTRGDSNNIVAVGYNALSENTADNNTAVGSNAGLNIKKAGNNTAIGRLALSKLQSDMTTNQTKKYSWINTASYSWVGLDIIVTLPAHSLQNGYKVSLALTSGDTPSNDQIVFTVSNCTTNTFTISTTVTKNTAGNVSTTWYSDNVLNNAISDGNTAIGANAMDSSVSGDNNVAVGAWALKNGNGSRNTAVGTLSASNLTTATNVTALGYGALRTKIDDTPVTTESNIVGIGFDSKVSGSNQIQLGNSGITTYAYGAIQDRSDIRDKADIQDTVLGLEFINKLRPVDFRWDYREDYEGEKDGTKKRVRFHHGLIAQEIEQVIQETGIDFGGFQDHSINGGVDVLSVGYTELISPLIKAVQELTARVKELENKNG